MLVVSCNFLYVQLKMQDVFFNMLEYLLNFPELNDGCHDLADASLEFAVVCYR